MSLEALEFRGGSHHGLRPDPRFGEPFPDTLFCITMEDGETYARTGEKSVDSDGTLRAVFAFDSDGTLTRRAQETYCRDDIDSATR